MRTNFSEISKSIYIYTIIFIQKMNLKISTKWKKSHFSRSQCVNEKLYRSSSALLFLMNLFLIVWPEFDNSYVKIILAIKFKFLLNGFRDHRTVQAWNIQTQKRNTRAQYGNGSVTNAWNQTPIKQSNVDETIRLSPLKRISKFTSIETGAKSGTGIMWLS